MSANFIKKKKKLYTEYEMLFDEFFFFFDKIARVRFVPRYYGYKYRKLIIGEYYFRLNGSKRYNTNELLV